MWAPEVTHTYNYTEYIAQIITYVIFQNLVTYIHTILLLQVVDCPNIYHDIYVAMCVRMLLYLYI